MAEPSAPASDDEAPQTTSLGDEVIVHGETLVGPGGRLQSAAGKVVVTQDILDVILAQDVKEIKDYAGSYVQSEGITRALLAQDKLALLGGPNDLPFDAERAGDSAAAVANRGSQEDPRPFVGANPNNKWMPGNLPEAGKDPKHLRKFIGDEFPRMLAYSPPKMEVRVERGEDGRPVRRQEVTQPGQPAFWSHWPEGTDPADMKVINVNIATHLPGYMQTGSVAAAMEGRKNFSFNGQTLEESFTPITDKIEKAWRRYAKEFEKTFGIRLDIRRDDDDEPHAENDINVSVCGFTGGNPQLAGFASFPPSLSQWSNFGGLGHQQGYMLLNHEYCNSPGITDDQIYDLVLHEMGHFFGWVHPHDLGAMNMTQAEALNSTAMAYTDGKFGKFEGQEGVTSGVVELFFRRYMANPPELNTEYGQVYDLEKQFAKSGGENWQSKVRALTGMIPAIPIINNGKGAKLIGTRGNDILDTEPGHMSIVRNPTGDEQRFALVEGHMAKVYGLVGDNHIFTSRKGSQEIFPGPGNNQIHIYGPEIQDTKTINSKHSNPQNRDALVLHQDIFLANKGLKIEQNGNDIILAIDEKNKIVLKNQLLREAGVSSINVIDDDGHSVLEQDVSRYDLKSFQQGLLSQMKRHVRLIERERKEQDGVAPDAKVVEIDPTHPHVHAQPLEHPDGPLDEPLHEPLTPPVESGLFELDVHASNITRLPRSFTAREQLRTDEERETGTGGRGV